MTDVREIIARALEPIAFEEWHAIGTCDDCDSARAQSVDAILSALSAAGMVVVPSAVGYNDDAMLALAEAAIKRGVSRSSFAQCAEWAHDTAATERNEEG